MYPTAEEQEQISRSLSDFDVNELQCLSDFDKSFIHCAVVQWYGSLDEFNMFVRGPLKDEIVQMMLLSRVPLHYIILSVSPVAGFQLDLLAGLLAAGLPFEAWGKWLFGQLLALNMLVASGPRFRMSFPSFESRFPMTAKRLALH